MRTIKDYKKIKGFYDLREFHLSKKIFIKLWEIQIFLKQQSKNIKYFKKYCPLRFEKLKQFAAKYQQIILNCQRTNKVLNKIIKGETK